MRAAHQRLLGLAWPMILQSLGFTLTSFTDNLMVGQLGETTIAAMGNSMQLLFFLVLTYSMLSQGGGIVVAQYFGARQYVALRESIASLLLVGVLVGAILGFGLHRFGGFFVSLITLDVIRETSSGVPELAAVYLGIVGPLLIMQVPSFISQSILQSLGDTRGPMQITLAGVVLNAIGNFILIFGGAIPNVTEPLFTPLGLKGAAIATAFAWAFMAVLMLRRLLAHSAIRLSFRDLFRPVWHRLGKIVRLGYPLSLDGLLWQSATLFYVMMFNFAGTEAYAAFVITMTLRAFFIVPGVGIQQALAIALGQALGRNAFKRARVLRREGLKLVLVVLPAIGLIIALLTPLILSLYDISDTTRHLVIVMVVSFFVFSASGAVTVSVPGILRAGGETRAVLAITAAGFALVGAPTALIATLVLDLGVWGVFAGFLADEVAKSIIMLIVQRRDRWVRSLAEPAPAQPVAETA
ncbi:MATE family efflux transporter [Saccharospirillum salsuginis]|uniref:Multidrug-efflux transporter n=1 Tax=Saccharospirillum salsuginis TaxID=418750 RepID=A0A918N5C5_9GAMM|nr:MATE family efflux transporter [Saccharospirillum salsuginis]GGX41104.1 MATE family efflux transporter [Saccharospirillum salsuginis]